MDVGEVTDNSQHKGSSRTSTLPGDCCLCLHAGLVLGCPQSSYGFYEI